MAQTVASFDVHAHDARVGAEALWSAMRETDGLVRCPNYGGYHVVARYDDVIAVLTNPAVFASGPGINLPPARGVRTRHIPAEVDAPAHRAYCRLIAPNLSAAAVQAMEPRIRAIVRDLVATIPDDRSIDFVRVFARRLPILVALELLCLPKGDAADLEDMVEGLHREVATHRPTGASDRLKAYAARVASDRARTASGDEAARDIVSAIVFGGVDGRPLDPDEQMSMIRLIMVGSFDTTAIALVEMVRWLAETPEEVGRLRVNPGGIDLASEEIVRFASPSTCLRREVTRDTVLAGTSLRAGDSVLIAFGAANRDPVKFACPDIVVAGRKPNMHVGFGAGPHRCVGSVLAKAQMRIAVEELLAAFVPFHVDGSAPVGYISGLGQGIGSLPMVFARR